MRICIHNLETIAIIGIYPEERITPQPILTTIECTYSFERGEYIDYGSMAQHIHTILQTEEFFLLEDAILFLETFFQKKYPSIETIQITLCKPNILPKGTISVSNK